MKRNPRFRAHMEGAERNAARVERITFAICSARAELAAHAGRKTKKKGKR